jgi:hypothetical protein
MNTDNNSDKVDLLPPQINAYYFTLTRFKVFFVFAAFVLSIVTLALVRNWTSDNGAFFLGDASWETNLFAYHVVFMVGGFFFCQVWAISIMNYMKGSVFATPIHIICHCGALGTLISGLYAIIKNKNDSNRIHLASLHSWIGVLATSFYMLNFMKGAVGKINAESVGVELTHPSAISIIGNSTLYRIGHVTLGICSIISTAMAILTGILHTQGNCTYDLSATELSEHTKDPAYLYKYLAVGCKVQNGIGFGVIFATLCVCISTLFSLITEAKHSLTLYAPKAGKTGIQI